MQSSISFDDIIASKEKFGCVLLPDLKKVRDLKKLNPQSKYDTTYIPLLFKHPNGKTMKVKVKFSEQIIASGAKVPQGSDEDNIAKNLNISFMKMSREEIEGGDYVPKKKEDPDEQEAENKRVADNITRYMKNNEKFLHALDILDTSYKEVCERLKEQEKTLDFRIKKDRKQTDIIVYSMKQTSRFDKDTDKEEQLENPIYRLKLPVNKKDGRIGIWSNYYNTFKPTVFDARKMTKKNNYQPVPAKVKVEGKLRDLDINNASSFIVYKSLVGGTLSLECIVASKFGLSLSNSFYNLYVFRHKTKITQPTLTKEEILAMRGGCEEEEDGEEDSEVEVEEDEKYNDEEEEGDDDGEDIEGNDYEPHDSDEEEEDEDEDGEEEVPNKKSSIKAGRRKKTEN